MKDSFKDLFKGCWTVPNLLSFLRIVMVPIFAVLFYKGEFLWAVVVLFLSGISDTLDGKIARRFNQVSALGKILDPVADKITQITIAIMLFLEFNKAQSSSLRAFSWVFLVFLIKEAVMILGGAVMLACGIRPGAAEIYGKVATLAFYAIMLVIMIAGPEVGALVRLGILANGIPEIATMVLVVISAALTIVAFISYLPGVFRQFKERAAEKKEASEK